MSDNQNTLKSCPFCGGIPYLANVAMAGCLYVVCTDCRMQSDDGSRDRVVNNWNTRTPPKIKPLVWHPTGISYLSERGGYRIIDTPGRTDAFRLLVANFGTTYVGDFSGNGALQSAKTAANADYERRILAALE